MGKRRLAFGIILSCAGLLVIVGSVVLGFLLVSNVSSEIVLDEEDLVKVDENEYTGKVWYQSLSTGTRVRIISRSDTQFDFTLIIRDPDGWIVKNQTGRTPFNKDLTVSTTLPGDYEFRLRILSANVSYEEIQLDILGSDISSVASSGCSLMMCSGIGGGMMILFGIILGISHFMGMYENEDRLKNQPDSTPIEIVQPSSGNVQRRGVPKTPPGYSKYQHARQLEMSGRYLEAMGIYAEMDLPLDAARCQSMHQNTR